MIETPPRVRARAIAAGRGGRHTLAVPLAMRLAARIGERPWDDFLGDPTQLANGLNDLVEAVRPCGVPVTMPTVLAEDGSGGRVEAALEATRRLRATVGDDAVLVAVLPAAHPDLIQLVGDFLRAGIDGVVLAGDAPTGAARTVANMARFHRAMAHCLGGGDLPAVDTVRLDAPAPATGLVLTAGRSPPRPLSRCCTTGWSASTADPTRPEGQGMRYSDLAIPLGHAWSSPFARWQGELSEVSSLDLAVAVTGRALADREVDPADLDGLVLGWTVPQPEIFYGAPTVAARLGAVGMTGPMVSQACATSVAALHAAAGAVAAGAGPQLVIATDRTSNGPSLSWPAPSGPGGAPTVEHWVLDNFARDPWAAASMIEAAEAVASELGASRSQLDELTALRWEQYAGVLAGDGAFQRGYLVPVVIPQRRGELRLDADGGVRSKELAGIRDLRPASSGGLHTFAAQTHPADGCAGTIVTTSERARQMSGGAGIVRLLASGFARVAKSRMPQAPVPAALSALAAADREVGDLAAVTTHNPFAVNDLYLSARTGIPVESMNAAGCSLIFGHPQGPTGLRSIAELIETLRRRGGGLGLFTGCAAGDTGAAVVLEVTE